MDAMRRATPRAAFFTGVAMDRAATRWGRAAGEGRAARPHIGCAGPTTWRNDTILTNITDAPFGYRERLTPVGVTPSNGCWWRMEILNAQSLHDR
jgi:hypothetical protein